MWGWRVKKEAMPRWAAERFPYLVREGILGCLLDVILAAGQVPRLHSMITHCHHRDAQLGQWDYRVFEP